MFNMEGANLPTFLKKLQTQNSDTICVDFFAKDEI